MLFMYLDWFDQINIIVKRRLAESREKMCVSYGTEALGVITHEQKTRSALISLARELMWGNVPLSSVLHRVSRGEAPLWAEKA